MNCAFKHDPNNLEDDKPTEETTAEPDTAEAVETDDAAKVDEAAATEATALRERIAQGMKPGNRRQRKRPARSQSTGDDSDAGEEEGGGVIGPPEMPAVRGPADMPGADPPLSAPIGPGPPPEGLKRRKVVMSSYLRDSSDEER